MAVVENAGINVDSSNRTESMDQSKSNHMGTQQHHHQGNDNNNTTNPILRSNDHQHHHQSFHMIAQQQKMMSSPATMNNNTAPVNGNGTVNNHKSVAQVSVVQQHGNGELMRNHGDDDDDDDGGEGFKREMRDLEEMLSKLNPMAEEFVPPSLSNYRPLQPSNGFLGYSNNFLMQTNSGIANGNTARRKKNSYSQGKRRINSRTSMAQREEKKNSYSQGKRRINSRTSMAQREEVIRRTVYVSDIDHQVTEEQLAALFISCGQVVDCRVCGDPNSVLRFAFIEFTDEEGARNALSLAGTMLGYYPVRVLPSKTAIAPVNPTFLPRSEDEREMCARTIYCTNIDKKVTQADVKLFFESICGEVHRLRLLGDYQHSTHIAFVEFIMAESAIAALNCSGAVLGSLPISHCHSHRPPPLTTPTPPILSCRCLSPVSPATIHDQPTSTFPGLLQPHLSSTTSTLTSPDHFQLPPPHGWPCPQERERESERERAATQSLSLVSPPSSNHS
ncbi:hypothetical protein TEA_005382 [Camellia sinensis var. sinensis]|uniref:RRM domain-containing protein n=1 Tax=Camellia sinensis var. sinensis TaxID=542762 RepID=A0A4S4DNN4_CAMSN|nr:hypothetical protein TEA_005382 [Camellia sinensis var. sinensis]